jgi:threonine aldolase
MLESGAWLRNAEHANDCAQYFVERMARIANVSVVSAVDANTVFLNASEEILQSLRERGWKFYTFIGGAARIMFAWDTDLRRVDALLRDLEECACGASSAVAVK